MEENGQERMEENRQEKMEENRQERMEENRQERMEENGQERMEEKRQERNDTWLKVKSNHECTDQVIVVVSVSGLKGKVCSQFSRPVYAMVASVQPDSFDTLHSYANTFQMPFVTPWFPENRHEKVGVAPHLTCVQAWLLE
ncbi:hypothetical protein Pcinc_014628 [Petrolisthes cinctipes]|uniref:Uncharacterized protein n=1 Tax=Petrolisthes cinctipes TaxID=88211 RepID=A0AAE1FUZ9_PETCI|nr:hypothetical protein Pcinc_014628 [Petrolisthes cinctipes]